MVYKVSHFHRVARGFAMNGQPVAHDHALGNVPLAQHVADIGYNLTADDQRELPVAQPSVVEPKIG